MSQLRLALFATSLLAAANLAACVDSAVTGVAGDLAAPDADGVLPDVPVDTDGGEVTLDTVVTDTDASDTDVSDTVDGGCVDDAQCVALFAPLTPCQTARCEPADGVCVLTRRDDCCETRRDCPTAPDPCVDFSCPVPGGACRRIDLCQPTCTSDRDCEEQAPACTRGVCADGACVFEPLETCCVTEEDCDDADLCTNDRCGVGGQCAYDDNFLPGCCATPPVVDTTFSQAPAFQSTSTSLTVRWQVLETTFTPSPGDALYLGDARTRSMASDAPYEAEASFDLGLVAAGSEVEVKFQAYLDVRPGAAVDQVRVLLRVAGQDRLVYTKSVAPLAAWHPVKRTLAVTRGGQARLILQVRTIDAPTDDRRLGVLIDDLHVRTGCGDAPACTSDAQCATADPCVEGRCGADGECIHQTIEGCCHSAADCPTPPDCFEATCVANACGLRGTQGCCTSAADCGASPDPCVYAVACVGGRCELELAPIECDDDDPCTSDVCLDGECVHQDIPGCCFGPECACQPDVADWDYEDSAQGWTLDEGVDGYGWIRALVQVPGQPRVLYFGNPDAGPSLDPGFPMEAAATSPPVSLPATAASITVAFDYFAGVDPFAPTDQLRLEAVTDSGQPLVLWQLDDDTPRYDAAVAQTEALGALIGQTVRLRFVYEATDTFDNGGFGFLVARVTISADCGGGECVTAAQCPPSPEPCLVAICQSGACGLADVDCDDGDACTDDRCDPDLGRCTHVANGLPGCGAECRQDSECEDGSVCTDDRCDGGTCVSAAVPGCCRGVADCDDGDACTEDRCALATGTCFNDPIPGCCQDSGACDDGDPCTRDLCASGFCVHQLDPGLPGCGIQCVTGGDCDDGDLCTRDLCDGGECANPFDPGLPGCDACGDSGDCDDHDPCTEDSCLVDTGLCLNQAIAGCCQSNAQCGDGDACTLDLCDPGSRVCRHIPLDLPGCDTACQPGGCDDGDPCTTDWCDLVTRDCEHAPIAGCCELNAECGDGDPCTFDQCDNNVCVHTQLPLPGCQLECGSDADCDDGNPCTTNRCRPNGRCRTDPILGCCSDDSHCDDGDACTHDGCLGGVGVCVNTTIGCNDFDVCTADSCDPGVGCQFAPIPGCCSSASQCDDGDPCTLDECSDGACVHAPSGDCCDSDSDCVAHGCTGQCIAGSCAFDSCCEVGPSGIVCDDGDVCTQDVCAADGSCTHLAVPGCCAGDGDCPADEACVDWSCDASSHTCVAQQDPECCVEQTFLSYDFTAPDAVASWTITPAQAPAAVTWWVSDRRASSSPFALYMGNPTAGDYDSGGVPAAYATTPPFDVPDAPGVELTFEVWLDVEAFADFDPFFVDVIPVGGQPVNVWDKTAVPDDRYRSWVKTKANLSSFAGATVRLRFRFEADDELLNSTEGIFIDDITLRAVCEPVTLCDSDFECDDGDLCTADSCVAHSCTSAPIPGCCAVDADCDDGYLCTSDTCVAGSCRNDLIEGCCVFDAECDDGKACTDDSCDATTNTCAFIPAGDCCESAGDCDDGDDCSSDLCLPDGTCAHGANHDDPGCCEEGTFFEEHFSASVLTSFEVETDGSEVFWRAHTGRTTSPPFALYYGDPAAGNYDSGERTFGTATSAPIDVPVTAHDVRLDFNIWLSVDGFFFDDLLSVRVITGDDAITLWERNELDFDQQQTWVPVSLALPPQVAGRSIRIRFAFDSLDELGNRNEGIYIDDIVLYGICSDAP